MVLATCTRLIIGALLVSGCSIFQGNDTVQSVPVASVQQGPLAPLPAVAPASQQAPVAHPPAAATHSAPGAVVPQSARPQLPPVESQAASANSVLSPSNAGAPPIAPPRAPGALSGAPAPPGAVQAEPFTPHTPRSLSGDWKVVEPNRTQSCRLNLSSTGAAGVLDAVTQGCASLELARTAGWQSRGEDIVLLDARASPIVLFRPAGTNFYEGLGLVGERFTLSR